MNSPYELKKIQESLDKDVEAFYKNGGKKTILSNDFNFKERDTYPAYKNPAFDIRNSGTDHYSLATKLAPTQ